MGDSDAMEPIELESLSLADLSATDEATRLTVRRSIERAFGVGGAGILVVRDLPSNFTEQRRALLDAGYRLPSIPAVERAKLEFESLNYSIGWSHGHEVFNGVRDFSKGSFYANPVYDDPSLGDADLVSKYPTCMHPNEWPSSPVIHGLQASFKYIGKTLFEVAQVLAKHCDELVQSQTHVSVTSSLYKALSDTRNVKGRLLHYFPRGHGQGQVGSGDDSNSNSNSTGTGTGNGKGNEFWCGFHNDHGTITGLLPAAMFNDDGDDKLKSVDPQAGLYVAIDGSKPRRVVIPPDAVAFQIGESAQIATGGVLRATAHAVRAPKCSRAARVTFVVFIAPNPWTELPLPDGAPADALDCSPLVPALRERYAAGQTVDGFGQATMNKFYENG